MGEAKSRKLRMEAEQREAFLQHLLSEATKWSSPATDEEIELALILDTLPRRPARRLPKERLQLMGMPPNMCHANCRWYAQSEPARRECLGWLQDADRVYVLHSLIEMDGELVCITPSTMGAPDTFEFIPDNKVDMIEDNSGYVTFKRNGIRVSHGVRGDPARMIKKMGKLRELLLSGVTPYKAMEEIAATNFGESDR